MDRARGSACKGMTGLVVATLLGLLGLVQSTYAAEFSCAAGNVSCLITATHTANSNGEINTITLAAGLYTLTTVDHDTDGPTGLPSIASALTLRGSGPQSTVIERASSAPPFRLLHVAATGVLTLEGLTLRGGGLTDLPGGGIYNRGTLTLTDSTLSGNTASEGGGIYHSEDSSGTLTITDSTLSGNVANGGGGIFSYGTLTIAHSTLSGNMASQGGGIGAFSAGAPLTITNSTLKGNVASTFGGGGISSFAPLTITNSTLKGNVAIPEGGGISQSISPLTLTNSTLSGNTAGSSGGGISISGGGLLAPPGHAILGNTILAQNTVPPTGTAPDCVTTSGGGTGPGQVTSQGHNLIGDPTGCPITLATSDLTGDPGLGDFIDDGTPGRGYFPLLPSSPAIETGDDATCPPTDQLGQPRVGHCDIGAIEFQPSPDADVVTISQAIFADRLALLFVTATSSAAPAATLFVTVPGCWEHAAMALLGERYIHLHADTTCGVLNGRMVVVTSSYGGAASALLR